MRAAGDFDYETQGCGYARQRRADPRIAAFVHAALGDARTVLNVGAGAGSYEPTDRTVLAVEPARAMRAQRPPGLPPAIDGVVESLPFDDGAFDASMALMTMHQWKKPAVGFAELVRVTRGPIVILTFDPDVLATYWLHAYVPELLDKERHRFTSTTAEDAALQAAGRRVEATPVPIPLDCTDGMIEAYYGRPERLLEPDVRRAQSSWSFVGSEIAARFERELRRDLENGTWDARFGHYRQQATYAGSLRLIVSRPG